MSVYRSQDGGATWTPIGVGLPGLPVLDLAIHPQNPEIFLPGTILTAEWDIVDELGRVNKGTTSLPLQRFEH